MKQSWLDDLLRSKGPDRQRLESRFADSYAQYLFAFREGLMNTMQDFSKFGPSAEAFENITSQRLAFMDRCNDALTAQAVKEGHAAQCERKCSYCCYQHVVVTSSEAIQLASYLTEHKIITRDLLASAELVSNLTHLQRFQQGISCPLLKNQLCSVYPVRPMPCRSYFSSTRHLCIQGWRDRWKPDAASTDILLEPQVICHSILMGSDAGFMMMGYQMVTLELADGLYQASLPGAREAWLAGQEVFNVPADNTSYNTVLLSALHQMNEATNEQRE